MSSNRHTRAFLAHLGGETYQSIARREGVSVQRAHQLSERGRGKITSSFRRLDSVSVSMTEPVRTRYSRAFLHPGDRERLLGLDLEFAPGDELPQDPAEEEITLMRSKIHLHSEQFDGWFHAACGVGDWPNSERCADEDYFTELPESMRCSHCDKLAFPHGAPLDTLDTLDTLEPRWPDQTR